MSIMLFLNLKGGVAKTTNAVAVAECLAESGHRTLVIDADHQCMSGELLLGEDRLMKCERKRLTLHDLMAEMLDEGFSADHLPRYVVSDASDVGGGLPNLSVIPCSIRIDDFSTNMAKARRGHATNDEFLAAFKKRRRILRAWLAAHYDFTIVDCPPSVAVQVKTFLDVADAYVVPAVPDRLSVRGSLYLLDRIRRTNLRIRALGTLWSLYREQNAAHRRIVQAASRGGEPFDRLPPPFRTIIPNASAISEATEPGRRPRSFAAKYTPPFAKLYRNLCEEIVQRAEWRVADVPEVDVVASL